MKKNLINIHIHDLSKEYNSIPAIDSVNLNFSSGQLNLLTGDNGSGKTTLIKCIMHLVKYKGRIRKKRYRIGYAPENYLMPDFMTGFQFLKTIGRIKELTGDYLSIELEEYLELFQIANKIHDPIRKLSNGMKQKINITQALLNNPKIIILDEPLVGLDFDSQKKLVKIIIDLSKNNLVIVSTHQPERFNTSRKKIFHFEAGKVTC